MAKGALSLVSDWDVVERVMVVGDVALASSVTVMNFSA